MVRTAFATPLKAPASAPPAQHGHRGRPRRKSAAAEPKATLELVASDAKPAFADHSAHLNPEHCVMLPASR